MYDRSTISPNEVRVRARRALLLPHLLAQEWRIANLIGLGTCRMVEKWVITVEFKSSTLRDAA